MITEMDIVIRLGVAFLLGAVIGIEREMDNQPAGLRTNIILVMGSALAMILSVSLAHRYTPVGGIGDPARLAAQVVSGVGFLGAGAILHAGANIRGLTTAATIWTMAVVGLAVGAGYFSAAVMVTVALFIVLGVLDKFEHRFFYPKWIVPVTMWIKDEKPDMEFLRNIFQNKHLRLLSISQDLDMVTMESVVELEFSCRRPNLLDEVQQKIISVPGLYKVNFGKALQI
ncbi:MAG: MgtC/SapB family protein [Anaerolineaceae bacterium]|jgi:putative Mg2+ transporter-C (MgtC) family protein|nr:MgtC/SapB family protein [Anaerolineaceae bacterium]